MSTDQQEELELAIEAERVEALQETVEWKNFTQKFDMGDARNQNLWDWLVIARLGRDASVEQRQRLLTTVVKAGGVVTLPPIRNEAGPVLAAGQYEFVERTVQEPTPEPEKDSRGHILGDSQLRWKEYREFAESHSSAECRSRAKLDRGFAAFVRLNLEREAQETPSTQFSIAGQAATENKPAITPELIAFAEEYRHTPTDQVRKLRSPSMSPLTFETYNKTLAAALSAGLIGR